MKNKDKSHDLFDAVFFVVGILMICIGLGLIHIGLLLIFGGIMALYSVDNF